MAALYRPVMPEDDPGSFSQERLLYIFYQMLGLCALAPNICLFVVLCYYKIYRRDYMLVIMLCVTDSVNCLSIIVMGSTLFKFYDMGIKENLFPLEALRQPLLVAAVLFICGSAILVGLLLAHSQRGVPIATVCGRKAAFGKAFGEMIYCLLIFGYLIAVFVNIMSCLVVSLNGISGSSSNVNKLKQAAAVSFVSFILISIPNISAILEANLHVNRVFLHLTVLAGLLAYSLDLFIYMAISQEFRERVVNLLLCGIKSYKIWSKSTQSRANRSQTAFK
ncbi:hypothetical protein Y032_0069g330 [Ancylostoma ceylanicum]|uniref:G-protein coupled receptors family 1 profile domain-containing protein n=1 Tax=Ancylostoma ceylanicum TaxID=53326 RepID=A0A016TYH5_9BILA|nr:hypothetical protein Y032_0069g330 [Ancylostoma ceylanicum]